MHEDLFNLSVLQERYLIGALAVGLVLLIAIVLTYMMMWEPRKQNPDGSFPPPARGWRGAARHVPWVLVLTFVGIIAYGVLMAVACVMDPPNW